MSGGVRLRSVLRCCLCCFFFNDTATTEIYTLSLHDALPIFHRASLYNTSRGNGYHSRHPAPKDRKSGSAGMPRPISYAVFCLKKKKERVAEKTEARMRCAGRGGAEVECAR